MGRRKREAGDPVTIDVEPITIGVDVIYTAPGGRTKVAGKIVAVNSDGTVNLILFPDLETTIKRLVGVPHGRDARPDQGYYTEA